MHIFADDAKVSKSFSSVFSILQHDIDDLTKWSSNWLLTFHADKCKALGVVKNSFRFMTM